MQCNASNIWWFLFYCRELVKIGPKIWFLGSLTPSYALWVASQFLCQMKGLMKIHNRGKFHLYSICSSQVIKFQMFSWQWSIHKMGNFGGFLGPPPQIRPDFAEIWTRGRISWDKDIMWTMFQNFVFKGKRDIPKVYSFGPFLSPIYPRKT